MSWFEPVRRGAESVLEAVREGWNRLRERSAAALTRFRRKRSSDSDGELVPVFEDTWGLVAAELAETKDSVIARLEIPGMDEKDFEVSVEDDVLVVRGEKRFEREEDADTYHVFEAAYGSFVRALPLPCEVDAERADATYKRGVLTVRLPKAKSARTRRIPIKH